MVNMVKTSKTPLVLTGAVWPVSALEKMGHPTGKTTDQPTLLTLPYLP